MKNANPEDMNLIKVVDTEDEVLEALDNFYKKYNFELLSIDYDDACFGKKL